MERWRDGEREIGRRCLGFLLFVCVYCFVLFIFRTRWYFDGESIREECNEISKRKNESLSSLSLSLYIYIYIYIYCCPSTSPPCPSVDRLIRPNARHICGRAMRRCRCARNVNGNRNRVLPFVLEMRLVLCADDWEGWRRT